MFLAFNARKLRTDQKLEELPRTRNKGQNHRPESSTPWLKIFAIGVLKPTDDKRPTKIEQR